MRRMVEMVAENVSGGTIPDRNNLPPEERPGEILAMMVRAGRR